MKLYLKCATNTCGIPAAPSMDTEVLGGIEDLDIETLEQEYTSEDTSINSSKLPSIFKLVKDWKPGTINLDYGGGRFDNAAEYLQQFDVTNLVYDPYNRTTEHNNNVIAEVRANGGADTATCCNVLNVIKEEKVRRNVIDNISKLLKPNGTAYFVVYEGSGNGEGRPTSKGYQVNKVTSEYLDEILEVFPDAYQKSRKLIVAPKSSASINSSIQLSSFSTLDKESIASEIEAEMKEAIEPEFKKPEYEFLKDWNHFETKVEDDHIEIWWYAEVSYDELLDFCDIMNKVAEKYDEDAYFEPYDAGVAVCYFWFE